MDKSTPPQLFSLLAFLCLLGIGILRVSNGEDGFSITTYYLGLGVTFAGTSLKIMTKPGMIILIAGIAGNILLNSTKPIGISAAVLAGWYLLDFTLTGRYKDKDV